MRGRWCWAAVLLAVGCAVGPALAQTGVVEVDVGKAWDREDSDDEVQLAFAQPPLVLQDQALVATNNTRTLNATASSCPRDAHGLECGGNGHCDAGMCVCDEGFHGPACAANTCPNACSSHGDCVAGRCQCHRGWTRSDCSANTCPNNCTGHGHCVAGACLCDKGWTTPDCSVDTCPNHCSSHGWCDAGQCRCSKGWQGRACDTDTCPQHCSGHGQCNEGVCECTDLYQGDDCSLTPCPGQCSGRGQCEMEIAECRCDLGWRGDRCDQPVCPNDCFAAKRQGVCVWAEEAGFPPRTYCRCLEGFQGIDCSTPTCPNNCSNRGSCVKGKCVCPRGFPTTDCSPSTCPNHCSGHGVCDHGACQCERGWGGDACEHDTCPRGCSGNGYCLNGVCQCFAQFTGPECGQDACPGRCSGHGECNYGECVCMKGWEGPRCELSLCESACSGHGNCDLDTRRCDCWFGWRGRTCDTEWCEHLNGCSEHGLCRNASCVCDAGWAGDDCSVDDCPGHCSGNGECVEGECECYEGWRGEACQNRDGSSKYPNPPPGAGIGDQVEMDPALAAALNHHNANSNGNGAGGGGSGAARRTWQPTRLVDGMERRRGADPFGGQEVLDARFDTYVTAHMRGCPNFCGGNGVCKGGRCKCDQGWSGEDCTHPTCPPYPRNGLDMTAQGFDPHGYSHFEYYPCNGNGDCITGVCQCYLGFSGDDCSIVAPRGFTGPNPNMERQMPTQATTACQSDVLALTCAPTEVVSVFGAFYGRNDSTTCLREGRQSNRGELASGEALQCHSNATLVKAVVSGLCHGKHACHVPVYNGPFGGDPCLGVFKYLQVQYACVDVDVFHNRSCERRCGMKSDACSCEPLCRFLHNCCSDFDDHCPTPELSDSPTPTPTPTAPLFTPAPTPTPLVLDPCTDTSLTAAERAHCSDTTQYLIAYTLRIHMEFSLWSDALETAFVSALTSAVSLPPSDCTILQVLEGSVMLYLYLRPSRKGRSNAELVKSIATQALIDGDVAEAFAPDTVSVDGIDIVRTELVEQGLMQLAMPVVFGLPTPTPTPTPTVTPTPTPTTSTGVGGQTVVGSGEGAGEAGSEGGDGEPVGEDTPAAATAALAVAGVVVGLLVIGWVHNLVKGRK